MKNATNRIRGAGVYCLKDDEAIIEKLLNPYGYNFGARDNYELDCKKTNCFYHNP